MHHLACGIGSLLHSVNLILFTVLLVHLILHISPHHSHHLHSHYLSLPRPFTPDLTLICSTNPFLHKSFWFHLNCLHRSWTQTGISRYWHLFVLVSTFIFFLFLVTCARLSWIHSAFRSTLNSCIVSFCMCFQREKFSSFCSSFSCVSAKPMTFVVLGTT